ncbi:hypothetical protein HOP51_08615 [Halomonas sp. MCCC 1A11036]|uniref:Uncharacterized protein n=1 Tax=Billgrantia zhangzhouensis TaxID=2733481 RepID=A0ABS9AEN6_9GAMM|nr:hypothetical protein [Halomonas zhangzhouensis]MCE8020176.1 hypothetical protein [Halomonas zhangzhouensis]
MTSPIIRKRREHKGRGYYMADIDFDAALKARMGAGLQFNRDRAVKALRTAVKHVDSTFAETIDSIEAVRSNRDMKAEAIKRKTDEIAADFIKSVQEMAAWADDEATGLLNGFSALIPVRDLKESDMGSHLRDQELRAFLRNLDTKERRLLLRECESGKHPELTAAMLRGPAMLSGITEEQKVSLANAGVVSSNPDEVKQYQALLGMSSEVRRTLSQAAEAVGKASGNEYFVNLAKGLSVGQTEQCLRDLIESLPLERLPAEPVPEEPEAPEAAA